MSQRVSRRSGHRQKHSCRVWWHAGFAAWVWRCWDCIEPGQLVNGTATSQPRAYGALVAHFRSGHGLTHNTTSTANTTGTTHVERWAA